MRRFPVLIAAALLTTASATQAHPKLLSATPAANTAVTSPAHVQLHFSETLVPAFSKADLVMAAMPGMPPMKMASTAMVASDGRTLVLTPKTALSRGRYSVQWKVVSTDTHHVAGTYAFAVK